MQKLEDKVKFAWVLELRICFVKKYLTPNLNCIRYDMWDNQMIIVVLSSQKQFNVYLIDSSNNPYAWGGFTISVIDSDGMIFVKNIFTLYYRFVSILCTIYRTQENLNYSSSKFQGWEAAIIKLIDYKKL